MRPIALQRKNTLLPPTGSTPNVAGAAFDPYPESWTVLSQKNARYEGRPGDGADNGKIDIFRGTACLRFILYSAGISERSGTRMVPIRSPASPDLKQLATDCPSEFEFK